MMMIMRFRPRPTKIENSNLSSCGEQKRGETPLRPHGCRTKRLRLSVRIGLSLHHTRTRPRTSLVRFIIHVPCPQTSTTIACCVWSLDIQQHPRSRRREQKYCL
ncbi:hypothetical protein BDU57DRAFT_281365 [Ampelomyces quisqualis]|uniref:Uncharacterized protein n=1 Tax=Ampelomyces quisqualis TaxID=50730 RepID=A0A6A5QLK6_AMPQU|nr:hypothetical protein BDU57DRAFT_281365 [Ampelomyces quisqualis]